MISRSAITRRAAFVGATLALWLVAIPAQANGAHPHAAPDVTMDWVTIGGAGNPADTDVMASDRSCCYGAVPYDYRIGTYDVTNAQYAAFLNAVASGSDPHLLYFPLMDHDAAYHAGSGIKRTGSAGSYVYAVQPGLEKRPVNYLNLYDAMRFANWMNNGQGSASTETGAYTLKGGGIVPTNALTIKRNAGAKIFLPNEDEWYKAAYYDVKNKRYYDYPGASNTPMKCALPGPTPNTANCDLVTAAANPANPGLSGVASWFWGSISDVGAYSGSRGPNGTYDMGGNVFQWTETFTDAVIDQYQAGAMIAPILDAVDKSVGLPFSNTGPLAVVRGTDYGDAGSYNATTARSADIAADPFETYGVRLAAIPEATAPAAAPAKPATTKGTGKATTKPATTPAVSAPHGSLAATGLSTALPLAGLGLLAVGTLAARRRRIG